jgi:hypothetical protein
VVIGFGLMSFASREESSGSPTAAILSNMASKAAPFVQNLWSTCHGTQIQPKTGNVKYIYHGWASQQQATNLHLQTYFTMTK